MIQLRSIFLLTIVIGNCARPCESAESSACHPKKYKNDPSHNCTQVVIPSGFCSSCKFRRIPDSGSYKDCTNVFETEAKECRDKIEEYLELNPCDTTRRTAYRQLTNTASSAQRNIGRLKIDYFIYALCELSCDCMPHTSSKNRKGEISVRRSNCQAHYVYDLCKLFPQVHMVRSPDMSMETMPTMIEPVCPKLKTWKETGHNWRYNVFYDIGTIEPDVAEVLYHTVKALELSNDVNWNACFHLETKQNRIADADAGWRTTGTINVPAGRFEGCFVWHDGYAYLIGGRKNPVVSMYDPQLRMWKNHTQSSKALYIHHSQCVSLDGKIWMPMAWGDDDFNLNSFAVYDPTTQTWDDSTYPPHPDESRRRGSGATVVYNGKIYTSHGTSGGHRPTANATAYLDVFDPADGSWTPLATAAYPRDHTGGAVIRHPDTGRDMLCVAGGRQSNDTMPEFFSNFVNPTECYDFASNTWQTYPDIPTPRAGGSYGATCDGKLMVAGGEVFDSGPGDPALDVVEIFDGKSWTTGPSLKQGRHGSGIAFDCRPCGEAHIASGNAKRGAGRVLTSTESLFYDREDGTCNWYAPESALITTPAKPALPVKASALNTPPVKPIAQVEASALVTPPVKPVVPVKASALNTPPVKPIVLMEAEYNPTQEIGISILLIVGVICVYLSYSSRSHGWYRHRGQRKQERRILRTPSPQKGPR